MNVVDLEGTLIRDPMIFDGKFGKYLKFTLACKTMLHSREYVQNVPCSCSYDLYEKYEAFMKEGCEVRCRGYFKNSKSRTTEQWYREVSVTELKARQPIDPTGGIAAKLREQKAAEAKKAADAEQSFPEMPQRDFMNLPSGPDIPFDLN